jgi:aminoglycoside phosphotransferase (APT) family kinase protein
LNCSNDIEVIKPTMSTLTIDPSQSEALASFLDDLGLGEGPISATRIGGGESNLTYLLQRGETRLVLRRPPPPPLPPSAHDVVREARIQLALAPAGVAVPEVLAICEDERILGAPFFVMAELQGAVITDDVPTAIDVPQERRQVGNEFLDGIVQLHAIDWQRYEVRIGKPTGYLERQLRLWSKLWEINATRELPACAVLGERLRASMPESPSATVVHGDYRLGNVMVSDRPPVRLLGILDWEMATIGDPLADLGYLIASWSEPGLAQHPMLLSPVTVRAGFPTRDDLIGRYADATGRDVSRLDWYQAFALWKAAVFCEAIYGRYLRGERGDQWSDSLRDGVPRLLEAAAEVL